MTAMAAPGFPIVGIGASAGGIEALEGLLPRHAGPTGPRLRDRHPSQPRARKPAARDRQPLHRAAGRRSRPTACWSRPIRVYVLPADAILGIERRRLLIRKPNSSRRERKPIDIFFSALAADTGELAAGVVLSGGDGDGTLGIKAIKERGGLTLAQVADGHGPQPSGHAGQRDLHRPRGFRGAGGARWARRLVRVRPRPAICSTAWLTTSRAAEGEALSMRRRREIYAILRNADRPRLRGYKTKTFLRRVQRRMQVSAARHDRGLSRAAAAGAAGGRRRCSATC